MAILLASWGLIGKVEIVANDIIGRFGYFEMMLCRNLLIYFSDATIKRILASFARSLDPNGVLLVRASESLLRHGRAFLGEERSGAFVYRKPGAV
jgi:chemotaxis protein methyltransferase CheR